MRILIVYGTNSGGTQEVSEIIATEFRRNKHHVVVRRASEPGANQFSNYDLIVLGSCTWERFEGKTRLEGQLQQHMYALTKQFSNQTLNRQTFVIFGLGDSGFTDFCAAADHLESFVQQVNGRLLKPILRIDGYFFDLVANRIRALDWAKSILTKKSLTLITKKTSSR